MAYSRSGSTRPSLELEDGRKSLDGLLKPAIAPGVVGVASTLPPEGDGEAESAKGLVGNGTVGTGQEQRRFPPWLIIGTWISLSTAVIFYNVRILRDLHFPYPVTLTTLHLAFQTVATQLLARFTPLIPAKSTPPSSLAPPASRHDYLPLPNLTPSLTPVGNGNGQPITSAQISSKIRSRMSSLDLTHTPSSSDNLSTLDSPSLGPPSAPLQPPTPSSSWYRSRPVPTVSPRIFWRRIVPIGILFSISLALSNAVYLYLSVAFIQMIKSASPIAVLLTTFAWGLRSFSLRLLAIVLLISFGIGVASYGEMMFSWTGFAMQSLAILVEANRVVMIQMLLQGEGAMSPLESLFHFAPVCFAINAALVLPLEGGQAVAAIPRLGPFVILTNAATTLLLNLSAVYLIQLSSLVLSLSKVVKDLILIFGSGLVLHTPISAVQWCGYAIAMVGLVGYKMGV